MFVLQQRVETWVHGGRTGSSASGVRLHSACDAPEHMGCVRVHTPVCRFPCSKRIRRNVKSAAMLWPAGGAACLKEVADGNTCDE